MAKEILTGSKASTIVKTINGRAVLDSASIHGLSASGKTITYTKGDDSTGTITTQDTTYSAGTGLSLSGTTFNHSNSITAASSGLYKISVDAQGHITGTTAVAKADITGLGIPASDTNTTYSAAANGGLTLSGTAFSITDSGVTAGSYGPSANATPAHSGTFSVPYITVDAKGKVTAASTKTITLPASGNTDTKNTAGSTDSSSKLFIIGATSQAVNPQTYSHDTAYVGTDGCLYSNSTKVSVEGHTHSYAASSHTHNYAGSSSAGGAATSATKLDGNDTMTYGWNGLNYFNKSMTAGCVAKTNDSPTTAWWHILRFNHSNASGYYTDLAVPFNSDSLYWKCVRGGTLAKTSWVKVLDTDNYKTTVTPANIGAAAAWHTHSEYVSTKLKKW